MKEGYTEQYVYMVSFIGVSKRVKLIMIVFTSRIEWGTD